MTQDIPPFFERIKPASILSPLHGLYIICGLAAVSTATLGTDPIVAWVFFGLFGIAVCFTLVAYIYWSRNDPGRLQREDYRMERPKMPVIGDERDPNSRRALLTSPKPVTNTSASGRSGITAMNAEGIRVYIVTGFQGDGGWIPALNRYLHDIPDVIAYWNYVPHVFCVKTKLSVESFAKNLEPFFPQNNLFIAEINPMNLNGMLPPAAWEWFQLGHHEKNRGPVPGLPSEPIF
jgi:hypothetical protein